jgi:GAF domain-containing protein
MTPAVVCGKRTKREKNMIVKIGEFKDHIELYERLAEACEKIIDPRDSVISSLANVSALLKTHMDGVNWLGFYLFQEGYLALGPFQGTPAVTRIELGKGVCGTAAESMKTMRVDDVKTCGNYISCDAVSLSEIVVPLIRQERLLGVMDIDSPLSRRFDENDERGLEKIAATLVKLIYP